MKWVRNSGVLADQNDFLPRRLHRDYILALMREAVEAKAGGANFEHICREVTDVDTEGGRATIHVENKGPFIADKAVLARGNFPPRHPHIENPAVLQSKRYIRDPWIPGIFNSLSRRDTVFLIGTGQTMIDLVSTLHQQGHEGRIIAISRRGLLPMAHRGFETYPSFFDEIKDTYSVLDIFRIVCKHLNRTEMMRIDKRAVIDSLRTDTQTIWLGLSEAEKRRFIRYLFRYWEVIRSRIPPESGTLINKLRALGQLTILSGRITDLMEIEASIRICYNPRQSTSHKVETAHLGINCIGPESDYRRIDHPLVRNLMRRGSIRPGPAHLGIDALPNGAIIRQNGVVSDVLYTLGSTMKGVLWEMLAVPDIRVQAEQLARLLLDRPVVDGMLAQQKDIFDT